MKASKLSSIIFSAVILVLSNGEDLCETTGDDGCPADPQQLCNTIKIKVVPCAKQLVKERSTREKESAQNYPVNWKKPSEIVAAHGLSSSEAKRLAGPACNVLCAKELIRERCRQEKLDTKALGIHLSVSNGELECSPIGSRKKRQVESCVYDQNIRCDASGVYRTIDGSCNNVKYPSWGKSYTPLERFLPADYADDIQAPRVSRAQTPLPSARKVSYEMSQNSPNLSHVHTFLHVTLGQMVDHDLTETVKTQVEINGSFVDLPCGTDGCNTTGPENTACFPIGIPQGDKGFPSQTCMKFVRTQEVLPQDCEAGQRQQLNRITSWLDASHVYGNTIEENNHLRDRTQPNRGLLKTTPHPGKFKPLLPQRDDPTCRNTNFRDGIMCFRAGDERVNDQIGLTALHTLFLRYHNYIEDRLNRLNPRWTGERKFQEARKILIAHWQNIVFDEFVPNIIGPDLVKKYSLGIPDQGFREVYNSKINPTISNSFATAAYRFGHSQITGNMMMVDKDKNMVKDVPLSQVLRDPNEIYKTGTAGDRTVSMIDSVMMGNFFQRAESTDVFFDKQITFHLFADTPHSRVGMDLLAINLQRGRDHGIPGYNKWRQYCGLEVYTSFDGMKDIPEVSRKKFKTLYGHVDDIDLYIAGVAETHRKGAAVGPTFGCIIAKNFQKVMYGDRFWFEGSDPTLGFTSEQLNSIKKATLSSVFCTAGDDMDNIQKYLLLRPRATALRSLGSGKTMDDVYNLADMYRQEQNIEGRCSQIHQINFNFWKEKTGNIPNLEFKGRATDNSASYDTATEMVTSNGKKYTAEQFKTEFASYIRKIAENNEKLSSSFISCKVQRISAGSVVYDYTLVFSGDAALTDSEVLSEIKGGLGNHPEFGLNINAHDITLGNKGISTIEILLITLGSMVGFVLLVILAGICCRNTVKTKQPRWLWNTHPHTYYNGTNSRICLVSPAYFSPHQKQLARPQHDYPRHWKPERMGGALYNSQLGLYGRAGYREY